MKALWEQARVRLEGYLREYANIPKGEHMHTDGYIFPAAAIYLTLKGAIGAERACSIFESASILSVQRRLDAGTNCAISISGKAR